MNLDLFQLVSAFYIMTVYDRVMPNNAIDSLIALTIGVGIVLIFDFIFPFNFKLFFKKDLLIKGPFQLDLLIFML